MKYYNLISNFCNNLKIEFNEEIYNKIIFYTKQLITYNEKFNLTAITDEESIIKRHFLDSISFFNCNIAKESKICDVGTGAGFPGIPIKILRNDLNIDLIEISNKKVEFLKHIIEILDLSNINIIRERVENVSHETLYREKYDIVTSRAVSRLDKLLELSFALVNTNGKLIAFKGINFYDEIIESIKVMNLMGGEFEKAVYLKEFNSSLVVIKKIKETPTIYPREYKKILKKSL